MRRLPTNSLITNLLHRQPYVDTILFSGGKILIKKLPLLHEWKKRRKEKSRKMGSEHPEKNQTRRWAKGYDEKRWNWDAAAAAAS